MEPQIIGKKIQQLYPQYANTDPTLIGQKYLAKYGGAVDSIKAGQLKVTDLPENTRTGVSIGLTALSESGVPVKGSMSSAEETKARAKADADRILTQLEDLYFNGNQGKGLHYGRLGGVLETAKAISGVNPDLNTYLTQLQSDRPTFTKAAGDVGNFSQAEQQAAIKQFPTQFSTKTEAQKYFAATRKKFGLKPSLSSFNQ